MRPELIAHKDDEDLKIAMWQAVNRSRAAGEDRLNLTIDMASRKLVEPKAAKAKVTP